MAAWETRTSLPAIRREVGSGVIGDKLYVAGGQATSGAALATCVVYDPTANSWATFASMPEGRVSAASGVISDKLYVVGGLTAGTRAYDPNTDLWSSLTSPPTSRRGAAGAVYNGKLYVFGGNTGGAFPGTNVATTEAYDPAGDSWTTLTSMPAARAWPGAATIGSYIYVVGGGTTNNLTTPATVFANLYRYDPAGDSWTTLTSMGTARIGPNVIGFNGKLYVAGGLSATQVGLTTFEEYDPAGDSWATLTAMSSPGRGASGAGLIASKYFHVAGGWDGGAARVEHHRYVFDTTHWWVGSVH